MREFRISIRVFPKSFIGGLIEGKLPVPHGPCAVRRMLLKWSVSTRSTVLGTVPMGVNVVAVA